VKTEIERSRRMLGTPIAKTCPALPARGEQHIVVVPPAGHVGLGRGEQVVHVQLAVVGDLRELGDLLRRQLDRLGSCCAIGARQESTPSGVATERAGEHGVQWTSLSWRFSM
jgi:hypothetical protein